REHPTWSKRKSITALRTSWTTPLPHQLRCPINTESSATPEELTLAISNPISSLSLLTLIPKTNFRRLFDLRNRRYQERLVHVPAGRPNECMTSGSKVQGYVCQSAWSGVRLEVWNLDDSSRTGRPTFHSVVMDSAPARPRRTREPRFEPSCRDRCEVYRPGK